MHRHIPHKDPRWKSDEWQCTCGLKFKFLTEFDYHLEINGSDAAMMYHDKGGMEKIKKAIETIESSKETHVQWLKYFEKYPQQEKNFQETIHSAKEQRKIIADYDNVLEVLTKGKGAKP